MWNKSMRNKSMSNKAMPNVSDVDNSERNVGKGNQLKNINFTKNKHGKRSVDLPEKLDENSESSDSVSLDSDVEEEPISDNELIEDQDWLNDLDFVNLVGDIKTTEESTNRLAVLHFDFETYTLKKLSSIIKSVMPITTMLNSITKYPTDYYMARVNKDIEFGPKEYRIQDCELFKANRKYAISRLKCFIAVFEFDSIEASDAVYNKLDDIELGDSGLKFDLRYVPDDMIFEIPDNYLHLIQSLDPSSIKNKGIAFEPSCFTQIKYKQTWDDPPLERQAFCKKAFDQSDCDLSDVEDYCGGATESDLSTSGAESNFYSTVDGPIIPKLRIKRISSNQYREMFGLPKIGDSSIDGRFDEFLFDKRFKVDKPLPQPVLKFFRERVRTLNVDPSIIVFNLEGGSEDSQEGPANNKGGTEDSQGGSASKKRRTYIKDQENRNRR